MLHFMRITIYLNETFKYAYIYIDIRFQVCLVVHWCKKYFTLIIPTIAFPRHVYWRMFWYFTEHSIWHLFYPYILPCLVFTAPPPTHQGGMDTWTHAYTQTQTNCIHLCINIHILHTYTYFMYIMYPSKTLIYRKRPWPSRGGGTTRCWATYIYTYLHTYLHTCIDACNRWLYIRIYIYIYIQSYTRLIRRLRK